jgi:hypothetical protein
VEQQVQGFCAAMKQGWDVSETPPKSDDEMFVLAETPPDKRKPARAASV